MGLPSLDVHLLRRGAILHLTLCGGACREEMQSGGVSRGKKDLNTNNCNDTLSTPPGLRDAPGLPLKISSHTMQHLHTFISLSLSTPPPLVPCGSSL